MSFAAVLVLAVAALILLLGPPYLRDLRRARRRVHAQSRIAQTHAGPIEYGETGYGPPVLVVHGAGGGYDQGIEFGQGLVDAGLRVIAMSRFGYLGTTLPADASPQAQADAHAALLESLGIAKAAVIGASAGAPSAIQFALRHPAKCGALVLVVPLTYAPQRAGAPAPPPPRTLPVLLATALRFDFLFWLAARFARRVVIGTILATPPEVVDGAEVEERHRVQRMIDSILPVSERRRGLLNDGTIAGSLTCYELERVAVPTLVVSVADDRFDTYPGALFTAESIPGARFVGYPSGGHVWVGNHRDLIVKIAAFLLEARGVATTRLLRPSFGR